MYWLVDCGGYNPANRKGEGSHNQSCSYTAFQYAAPELTGKYPEQRKKRNDEDYDPCNSEKDGIKQGSKRQGINTRQLVPHKLDNDQTLSNLYELPRSPIAPVPAQKSNRAP